MALSTQKSSITPGVTRSSRFELSACFEADRGSLSGHQGVCACASHVALPFDAWICLKGTERTPGGSRCQRFHPESLQPRPRLFTQVGQAYHRGPVAPHKNEMAL